MLQTLRTNPLPTPEPPSPHQATLDELAQLGLDLARHVQQRALATTEAAELANLSAAFDRTARTVRRTVLLSQHLQAQPHPIPPARARELVRRDAIRALGDDLFHRPQPERQALEREFLDRLDHPDTELDLLDTPTQHVIDTIRRDLGLVTVNGHTIFKRRTPMQAHALNEQARTTSTYTPPAPPADTPPATPVYTSSPDLIRGPDQPSTRNPSPAPLSAPIPCKRAPGAGSIAAPGAPPPEPHPTPS